MSIPPVSMRQATRGRPVARIPTQYEVGAEKFTVTALLRILKSEADAVERRLASPYWTCQDCAAQVRAKEYFIVGPKATARGVCEECKELRVALWRLGS